MKDLKIFLEYMTLKELRRADEIIKRLIKAKEDQQKLIKKILK